MGRHALDEKQLEFFKDEVSIDTSKGVRVCNKCQIKKPIPSFPIYGSVGSNVCKACVKKNNKRIEYLRLTHPPPGENYRCPICNKNKDDLLSARKPEKIYFSTFVLDHDHNTGEFRGYICWKCNSALGFFEDKIINVRKALHFLEQYEKGENKT